MRLSSLQGNSQKLDGGAMFGNAPKALWSKWTLPDEGNRIALSCRALLVESAQGNILLETGIGNFFEPTLKARYGVVEDEHVLLNSLAQRGLSHEDIDVVILSHLHFDHAGGLLSSWQADKKPSLLFPNAQYLVSEQAWQRAEQPHDRDRASFIPELNALLKESGRLTLVNGERSDQLNSQFRFIYSEGHTPGMMLTEINMPSGPIVFAADLIPGTAWVHVPITMGYDRFPEHVIDEKKELLNELVTRNGRIFYTHDPEVALSNIEKDEKERFKATQILMMLDGLDQ
jgi:glyoxylase-like metal-dependent hydrolase (beta-lactamase superfamily II)